MSEYSLLLVDDEPNILSSLRRLLRREGYKLHLASCGTEALEIIARERVDVIITDGRMPGMDGIELLKKIKAHHPDTVRMILSGYTDVSDLAGAINEGEAYRFILKPWNDEELKLTIRHALEHHRLAKENEQLIKRIKQQNQELKLLNANLEQAVEKQTRQLRIHNRVLMLAQQILDHLPIAVLGIDTTGTIVQANRRAVERALGEKGSVGSSMATCLHPEVQEAVERTISVGAPQVLPQQGFEPGTDLMCYPLNTNEGTRGAIVVSYNGVNAGAVS